jgi:hypothetical protein
MPEWNSRGRHVTKGGKCILRDPDEECLWSKDQTSKTPERRVWVDYESTDYSDWHDYGLDDPMAWECPINQF